MKVYKTFLISSFVFFILSTSSSASSTYFNFSLPSIFLKQNTEYNLSFFYLLDGAYEKDFIIIPKVEGSLLEIYNEESKSWVKQNELRSNFPKLKPTMQLKLTNFTDVSTRICFDVQLLKTSEVYKTPCRTYWNSSHFLKYINAVNAKILEWIKEKS